MPILRTLFSSSKAFLILGFLSCRSRYASHEFFMTFSPLHPCLFIGSFSFRRAEPFGTAQSFCPFLPPLPFLWRTREAKHILAPHQRNTRRGSGSFRTGASLP